MNRAAQTDQLRQSPAEAVPLCGSTLRFRLPGVGKNKTAAPSFARSLQSMEQGESAPPRAARPTNYILRGALKDPQELNTPQMGEILEGDQKRQLMAGIRYLGVHRRIRQSDPNSTRRGIPGTDFLKVRITLGIGTHPGFGTGWTEMCLLILDMDMFSTEHLSQHLTFCGNTSRTIVSCMPSMPITRRKLL